MITWHRLASLLLAFLAVARGAAGQPGDLPSGTGASPTSELTAAIRIPGALQARVRFDHLTSADGLSSDSVFSVLQDRHGFLWFGTQNGLDRYDGYRITQYKHDPANSTSIGGDFIQFLFEDSRGGIWSGRSTLSRFDPATETFKRYDLPPEVSGRAVVWAMCEDRAGRIWLAASGVPRIYRIDPANGAFTAVDIGTGLPPQPYPSIESLFLDSKGILWIGSSLGLIRLDPATQATKAYPPAYPNPKILTTRIRGIAEDASGDFWLATNEGARNFFDPASEAFRRRWAAAKTGDLGQDVNNSISAGPGGVIWQGTTHGLQVFDPASGRMAVLRHHPADRYSLSADEIWATTTDRNGDLWVGTKGGGVNRFSPASMRFGAIRRDPDNPHSLGEDNVRAIYCDRLDIVWIGTYGGGLNRLDRTSGKWTHFRHDPRNSRSLDDDRVYSIYEDRSGELWIGTAAGINRLDRRTGAFTRFTRGTIGISGSAIPTYSLLEDRTGRFWFGAGNFNDTLDRQTGAVGPMQENGGLSSYEDRDGNLWFGAITGLTKMDLSGKIRKIRFSLTPGTDKPDVVQINFMHRDSHGIMWLATETGLIRFDPKTENYTRYATSQGLPDNTVQCIAPDREGNLWLSTNNGLSRFDPRTNRFSNYHQSDGLQGEQFNRKSCFVDAAGTMYFGGVQGFNIFDPRRIPPSPGESSKVVLTEFRLHGKVVPVGAGSVLSRPIWDTDRLNLSYQDNSFALEFAALSYRDQSKTRYRFRLDGLEAQWTEVDSRSRSARYTGLSPRNYRFRVQASTDGRNWSGQEASLAIDIALPWWMTRWSQAGAVLVFASLLFGTYKLRVRALQARGLRLQELVTQKTAELVEARNQAEQARMQAEQASTAKSAFLANMSHELRTPLNAILGFSNLLGKRVESEDQRRDLDIINRSGEHLLTLINDVLDVAKIEAGRSVLDLAPCDLWGIVRDVADMMRVRAAEKGLALELELPGDVPRYIRADAFKLRGVLINLVGNAVKYTERGSITLRVSAREGDTGGQALLRFEVEDTGVGIAPEDLERIFEPFEQAGRDRNRKGTGLGLAITRHAVQSMGGRIEVESTVKQGSCFHFEIPVETTAGFESAPAPCEVAGLEPGQPEYRILIVEDQRENWMVLQRMLQDAGFQVRVAENGKEAVECFREWRPEFIWMDLLMPVMDGIETTRQIRGLEGGRDVKIAALTASGSDWRRDEVLASGLDDYLTKPYRPAEIFEAMERQLGVRYRRAEKSEPVGAARPALSRAALAALPDAVREELRTAVVTLDLAGMSKVVDKVAQYDPELSSVLAQHARTYSFTAILNVLR